MKKICSILLASAAAILPHSGQSLTIVNLEMQYDQAVTDIYAEIYEEQTPGNAANWLGYVNRGDFDNSIIHRQAFINGNPFVFQGGGFTYVPQFDPEAIFCRSFGTGSVPTGDPVTAELGLLPFGQIYYVDGYDINGVNTPDGIPDSPANHPAPNEVGFVDADMQMIDDCTQVGDIFRTNTSVQRVPVDTGSLPVVAELGISNLKGTLAMALLANDPDSATNQWFINMRDNVQLNTQGGGFTVFGKLLGNGQAFFDDAFATAVPDPFYAQITGEFSNLPLVKHEANTLALDIHLIKVKTASTIFNIDSTDHDFGYIAPASNGQVVFTLTVDAAWGGSVDIDQVEASDAVAAPYSLVTDCEVAPIAAGNSCTITVDFDPTGTDRYEDSFDISFTDPPIPPITVQVNGTSQNQPKLVASDNTVNFEFLFPGLTKNRVVDLTNVGLQPLNFGAFNLDNTTEFAISDNCPASLATDEVCQLTLTFQPQSSGIKLGVVSIDSNDPLGATDILLVGAGSGDVIPDIDGPDAVNFGDTSGTADLTEFYTVTNKGGTELSITSINITGDDASDFGITFSDCNTLQIDETCDIFLIFNPAVVGDKTAIMTVNSDDPDEQQFEVQLRASLSSDGDKVPDSVELAAPNTGDFDNNGTTDNLSGSIASLPAANGEYVGLVLASAAFSQVELIDTPEPDSLPDGANLEFGSFSIEVDGAAIQGIYDIGFYMPPGSRVDKVFVYGPTVDNNTPHWFEIPAQTFNDIQIDNTLNGPVTRSLVRLNIGDGAQGDSDFQQNNSLTTTFAVSMVQSASSSRIDVFLLLLMTAAFGLRWKYFKRTV